MRLHRLLLLAVLAVALPPEFAGRAADAPFAPPSRLWQSGDSWDLEVQVYPRNLLGDPPGPASIKPRQPPQTPPRFRVNVRVAGEEDFAGAACWQVDYSFSSPLPPGFGGKWTVLVRREDGWPCRVLRDGEVLGDLLELIGGKPCITGAPLGLPLEFFPLPEGGELKSAGSAASLRFSKRSFEQTEVQEAFVMRGTRAEVMLKQVWRKGEKSWREYERHYKGQKDLVAKVVSPAALVPGPARPFADVPRVSDDKPNPTTPKDPDGLAIDPRLRVKISATFSNPTVPEILQHLQEATKVPLGFNERVSRKQPGYGAVSWHNRAAWVVMFQLAESESVAGHWEKNGDGYRLVGTVLHANQDEAAPRVSGWHWIIAVPLVVGVGAGVWLAVRRRRLGQPPRDPAALAVKR